MIAPAFRRLPLWPIEYLQYYPTVPNPSGDFPTPYTVFLTPQSSAQLGPETFDLPNYGSVAVTLTPNFNPLATSSTLTGSLNNLSAFYNKNDANPVGSNPTYTWGTDNNDIGINNQATTAETYDLNFTFLNGAPNPADLLLMVSGLAYGTTATVSPAFGSPYLVGEYGAVTSNPAGSFSTTLLTGSGTFYSQDNGDPVNTGWSLSQFNSVSGVGIGTSMDINVSQIPGDGIGFSLAYVAVPEPTSMFVLGLGAMGLLGRRTRRRGGSSSATAGYAAGPSFGPPILRDKNR